MLKPVKKIENEGVSYPVEIDPAGFPLSKGSDKAIAYYAVPRESALHRILRTISRTAAGENVAGKILEQVKGIGVKFLPFGRAIKKITDLVGDQLKTQTKKSTDMNWLLQRLTEKSTWRGIIATATAIVGVSLSPELTTDIVAAGVALIGLVEWLFKEPQSKDATSDLQTP